MYTSSFQKWYMFNYILVQFISLKQYNYYRCKSKLRVHLLIYVLFHTHYVNDCVKTAIEGHNHYLFVY